MNRSDKFSEVRAIADAVCNNVASVEQLQTLEQLLTGDPEAQHFYYDYIRMHIHLQSAAEQNLEFVYRRMTEEFIVRPTSNDASFDGVEHRLSLEQQAIVNNAHPIPATPNTKNNTFGVVVFIFCLLSLVLSWFFFNRSSSNYTAEILQGHFTIVEQGSIDSSYLFAGEYQVTQDAELRLPSGDILSLTAHTIIKLFNEREIELKRGVVNIRAASDQNIIVHGPSFTLYSNGSELSLDLTTPSPTVHSGDNTLLLPNRWRPNHYWSFDSQSDMAIDSASSAYGIPAEGATRTAGLIGLGAFMFDNSADARIDVGSGGGTAPATGSFAVIDGVTIEVLIRPEYSGERREIDEIFRKDQSDGDLRMLLSFQHDKGKDYLKPEGDFNESLSFGLFVVGQGYHELKLPLDGLHGRPTLAKLKSGKFQHIVATYNVKSGLKSIYINGIQHAFYQYPPGSKMLSGGAGKAAIGNTPAIGRWSKEAFSGVIDEVAFYDFSLPPFMLQQHYEQVQQGRNYFGFFPSYESLPQQIKIPLPANAALALDRLTGLPHHSIDN